jgi:hypothetical protein
MATLEVPGGRSTLRLAGIPDSVPRGMVLPLLVRLLHADPPGSTREQDERLARVQARVARLAAIRAALVALEGRPVSLQQVGANGVAEALTTLGLEVRAVDGRPRITNVEGAAAEALREAVRDAGIDTDAIAAAVNGGGAATIRVPSIGIASPISEGDASGALVSRRVEVGDGFRTLLLERGSALALHGLFAMSPQTRAWLLAHRATLYRLANTPGPLCVYGRSLSIESDGVALPGGRPMAPAWEALAGVPAADVERFVFELFTRDAGRLAYFYDLVARLTPEQRSAVFRGDDDESLPDAAGNAYAAFLASVMPWQPWDRPFAGPVFDGALVIDELAVTAEGRPVGPRWRRFWRLALEHDELPKRPGKTLRTINREGDANITFLLQETALPNLDARRRRFEHIRFMQRVLPEPTPPSLEDALIVARGFHRWPALLLALERMGVRDAALLARAVRRAAKIDGIGDDTHRYAALAQFQGTLALVDGLVAARSIDAADVSQLVDMLVAVPLDRDAYRGGVAAWFDTSLLPALARRFPAAGNGADVESSVIAAWSGPGDRMRPFDWEGQHYILDTGAAEQQRLRAIRTIQGSSGLTEALLLWREAAAMAKASAPEGAAVARLLEDRAAALRPVSTPWLPRGGSVEESVRALAEASGAKGRSEALGRVGEHVDRALAKALLSLAYTRHLGDPESSVIEGDGLPDRHEFGPGPTAWSRPAEDGDARGRHLRGALLGIDLALARLALRRVSSDAVPPPRAMNENVLDLLRETVALSERQVPSDEDLALVAGALERGRARVTSAGGSSGDLGALATRAHVGEWRREALAWMAGEEPDRVTGSFEPSELLRLGDGSVPDALGTSASAIDGCWCMRVPRARPWEDVSGRPGVPRVAAQLTDLGLRLAELLHALGVPAALYHPVLAIAAQDFVDRAVPLFPEDWPALAAAAADLTRDRVEDFVSGLAGAGPLRIPEQPTR